MQPQYYISYVVIKGSLTNPMGHSYMVLSKCGAGPNDRPEVEQAVGQYGDQLRPDEWLQKMIFPARLFGPGHLKEEHLRHIVVGSKYLHDHKTWQISKAQRDQFMAKIEADIGRKLPARNFSAEYSFWKTLDNLKVKTDKFSKLTLQSMLEEEQRQIQQNKGPHFNIVRQSCMADAKCRLKELGLDVSQMEGYLVDLPTMTSGPLDKMELKYDQASGKVFWQSPLILSPHKDELTRSECNKINRLRVFGILHRATFDLEHAFRLKCDDLQANGLEVPSFTYALKRLQSLKRIMAKAALYPNRCSASNNARLELELKSILQGCHRDLIKSNADPLLVQFVRDLIDGFNHFVYSVKSYFRSQGVELALSPFGFARQQTDTMEAIHHKIEQVKLTAPAA